MTAASLSLAGGSASTRSKKASIARETSVAVALSPAHTAPEAAAVVQSPAHTAPAVSSMQSLVSIVFRGSKPSCLSSHSVCVECAAGPRPRGVRRGISLRPEFGLTPWCRLFLDHVRAIARLGGGPLFPPDCSVGVLTRVTNHRRRNFASPTQSNDGRSWVKCIQNTRWDATT